MDVLLEFLRRLNAIELTTLALAIFVFLVGAILIATKYSEERVGEKASSRASLIMMFLVLVILILGFSLGSG